MTNKTICAVGACLLVVSLAASGGTDVVPLETSGAATGSVTAVVTNTLPLSGELYQIDAFITGLIASPTGTFTIAFVTNETRLVGGTVATFSALTSTDRVWPLMAAKTNNLANSSTGGRPYLLRGDKLTLTLSSASKTGITAKVRFWLKRDMGD